MDPSMNVTLAELICLLCQCFGMVNQVERFQNKLSNCKRKPGEELQQLYNEVCRLMLLAYPGPSSDLTNVVGRDAFLEALDNPSLHVHILDKVPGSMEEALCIALNLEVLDKSRDTELKAEEDQIE